MLNIPNKCRVGNTIYKKLFYDNGDLSTADKDLFTANIEKILWLYCLKPETINIKPYKDEIRDYPEIEFLEVILSSDTKVKRIAEIIMRTIPYPMILIFTLEEKTQIWTAHQRINQNDSTKNTIEDFIHTEWLCNDDKLFDSLDITKMNMTNFFTLYSEFVDKISIYIASIKAGVKTKITGDEARELTARIEQLDTQIVGLKAKLKKETQFNRRIEINIEVKNLEQRKKEISGGI